MTTVANDPLYFTPPVCSVFDHQRVGAYDALNSLLPQFLGWPVESRRPWAFPTGTSPGLEWMNVPE